MSYLRFTPDEYKAIERVCHSHRFTEGSFAGFKRFLVTALAPRLPPLAQRVSGFARYQTGILYEHLKKQRKAQGWPDRAAAAVTTEPKYVLSVEHFKVVVRACQSFVFHKRFLSSFRAFLVRRLKDTAPGLCDQLAALSEKQVEVLYELVDQCRRRAR
jgi:hypothetical protein